MDFDELKKLIESNKIQEFIEYAKTSTDIILLERDIEFDCSLLDWAAIYNRPEIAAFLTQHSPKLLTPRKGKRSSVHYAARHGSFESLRILLDQMPDLECKDHDQKTALVLAEENGHIQCMNLIKYHDILLRTEKWQNDKKEKVRKIINYLISNIHATLLPISDFINQFKLLIELLRSNTQNENKTIHELAITLLNKRPRISEDYLTQIIIYCIENYNHEERAEHANRYLFDSAINLMLEDEIPDEGENRYIGHHYHLEGDNFEGMNSVWLLKTRIRFFLEILVKNFIINNQGSLSSTVEQHKLFQEIIVECETFTVLHIIKLINKISINQVEKDKIIEVISNNIIIHINNLKMNEEYSLCVGYPTHAIYLNFTHNNNIIIRVDNRGRGSNEHDNLPEEKNLIYPKVIGEIDFPITNDNVKKYIIDVLKGKICSSLNSSSSLKEEEIRSLKQNIIKNIYQGPNRILSKTMQKINFPAMIKQITGNCAFTSHEVGLCIRLGITLFTQVTGLELALLKEWKEKPIRFPELKENTEDFYLAPNSIYLNKIIGAYYKAIAINLSKNYLMEPRLHAECWLEDSKKEYLFLSLEDLFSLEFKKHATVNPYHFLIEGSAGIGKTTLCKLILIQSLNASFCKNKFSKIFYIPLRNLTNNNRYPVVADKKYTLFDIVVKECFSPAINRSLYDFECQILKACLAKETILWILDGLDELYIDAHMEEAINTLSKQEYMILTSRPLLDQDQDIFNIGLKIKLREYEKKEAHSYIKNFFEDRPEEVKNIENCLSSNPALKKYNKTPIILKKFCELWREYGEKTLANASLTKINQQFIDWLLVRAFQGQLGVSIEKMTSLTEGQVTNFYKTTLKIIEHLAYEAVKYKRQLILEKNLIDDILNEHCITSRKKREALNNTLRALGVLHLDSKGGEFIHATFQEFFASRFIVKYLSSIDKNRCAIAESFFESHISDAHYKMILTYTMGLLVNDIKYSNTKTKRENASKGLKRIWKILNSKCSNYNLIELEVIPLLELCYDNLLDTLIFISTMSKVVNFVRKNFINKPGKHNKQYQVSEEEKSSLYSIAPRVFKSPPITAMLCEILALENKKIVYRALEFIEETNHFKTKIINLILMPTFIMRMEDSANEKIRISCIAINWAKDILLKKGNENKNTVWTLIEEKLKNAFDLVDTIFNDLTWLHTTLESSEGHEESEFESIEDIFYIYLTSIVELRTNLLSVAPKMENENLGQIINEHIERLSRYVMLPRFRHSRDCKCDSAYIPCDSMYKRVIVSFAKNHRENIEWDTILLSVDGAKVTALWKDYHIEGEYEQDSSAGPGYYSQGYCSFMDEKTVDIHCCPHAIKTIIRNKIKEVTNKKDIDRIVELFSCKRPYFFKGAAIRCQQFANTLVAGKQLLFNENVIKRLEESIDHYPVKEDLGLILQLTSSNFRKKLLNDFFDNFEKAVGIDDGTVSTFNHGAFRKDGILKKLMGYIVDFRGEYCLLSLTHFLRILKLLILYDKIYKRDGPASITIWGKAPVFRDKLYNYHGEQVSASYNFDEIFDINKDFFIRLNQIKSEYKYLKIIREIENEYLNLLEHELNTRASVQNVNLLRESIDNIKKNYNELGIITSIPNVEMLIQQAEKYTLQSDSLLKKQTQYFPCLTLSLENLSFKPRPKVKKGKESSTFNVDARRRFR